MDALLANWKVERGGWRDWEKVVNQQRCDKVAVSPAEETEQRLNIAQQQQQPRISEAGPAARLQPGSVRPAS